MNASVVLGYIIDIATYFYDAFAIVYELGMQPLMDTLVGDFTILYTNPFTDTLVNYSFNIGEFLQFFDITGFLLHSIIETIFTAVLNFVKLIPFGDYLLSMPTAFGLLLFSSLIFFITLLIRTIVRVFT